MNKNMTVLVTGAGSGIGRATAVAFGKTGANVVVNYHTDTDEANGVLSEIKEAGGDGFIYKADVSREEEVINMFEIIYDTYSSLEVLVNNAGLQRDAPFENMTLKEWNKVIDVNLTGQFLCAREAIRGFKERCESKKGCIGNIIFISSVHDVIPWAGHINYAASKGGISLMMKSLALEVAPEKIRVNSISPGAIKTDINENVWNDTEKEKQLLTLIPYQRIGEPEDVAQVAVWLASNESDYITGSTIYVDGGMTLYPGFANNG